MSVAYSRAKPNRAWLLAAICVLLLCRDLEALAASSRSTLRRNTDSFVSGFPDGFPTHREFVVQSQPAALGLWKFAKRRAFRPRPRDWSAPVRTVSQLPS